jgi:signal transduction histidine kinase
VYFHVAPGLPLSGEGGYAVSRLGADPQLPIARLMRKRGWWLFLVVMAPLVGFYLFGPTWFNAGPVFNGIGLSAVVAIVVGVRVHRPRASAAWYLIALGQALFVTADVLGYNYTRFFGRPLPFPSIADVLYLGTFPALVAGLVLLTKHNRGGDRASLIDSVIIATGLGLLSWVFLMAPYADNPSLTTPMKVTSLGYPLMDLLTLAVAIRLAVSRGNRGTSYYLMNVSICALVASDTVYGWLQLHGGYQTGGLLDGGWIAFYLLLGAAALHPSMAVADGPAKATRLTRTRLLVLALATFVAPIAGLASRDRIVIAAAAIILFSLVLLRMVGLVQRQEAATARERALEKTADRLRELDQLKDDFIATVSHELRTPLTSIRGYLELMLDEETGPLNETQRKFLAVVERSTERQMRLVGDLLLVAQLGNADLQLELAPLKVGALVEEAVEAARPTAEAKGIALEFATDHKPANVLADAPKLAQVVDNLISNAIKFTTTGRVLVDLSSDAEQAVIDVVDTGMGIPPDEQERLFERFFRTTTANTNAIQGTGLGLSIAKAITDGHAGTIELDRSDSDGTTFRLTLPLAS